MISLEIPKSIVSVERYSLPFCDSDTTTLSGRLRSGIRGSSVKEYDSPKPGIAGIMWWSLFGFEMRLEFSYADGVVYARENSAMGGTGVVAALAKCNFCGVRNFDTLHLLSTISKSTSRINCISNVATVYMETISAL